MPAFKKILLALPFVLVGYWAFSGPTIGTVNAEPVG
jgi:hypothetical protein